jgi:hypothetical protein
LTVKTNTRNRITLLAVVLLFAAPLLIAWLLNATGWHPAKTRNHGDLIEPARDVSAVSVTLGDGSKFVWRNPQWQWTLLALPGARCAATCQARLAELLRMRITLNRNAERLRVIYLGAPLPPELSSALTPMLEGRDDAGIFAIYRPAADDDVALALADPNGLLMLHYPSGYAAAQLREDLMKVIH